VEALKKDKEVSFDFKSNVWNSVKENELSDGTVGILKEVIPE